MAKSKKSTDTVSPSPMHDDKKWRAQSDARTLIDAEEIKGDDERMKHVHKHLRGEKKKIRSIEDIKKARDNAFMKKDDDADDME
jgi:hypothetical protein